MKRVFIFPLMFFLQTVYAEKVVVQGDGFQLTDGQIIDEYLMQPEKIKNKIQSNPEELRKMVDGLYNETAFAQEARKQGLDQTPIVKKNIEFSTRRLLVKQLINEKTKSIKVPNLEPLARVYYDNHPDEFWRDESVRARHILVRFESDEKAEKKAHLEGLAARIEKGESFAEIAKEYSDDPGSAPKGGDLGRFEKGKMVKPFEEAAFKLKKKGELSEIFETNFGYHVIQLDEYYPRQRMEYSEVKKNIVDKLNSEYVTDELTAWRKSIIDPEKAVVNKVELDKVVKKIGNQEALSFSD